MANLAKTQTQWTRLVARELCLLMLAPLRESRETIKRYSKERTRIRIFGDRASATVQITALSFIGADYGVNLASDGKLFVRFVANAANWDVTFYTATGGGAGVAVTKATNVAASATGSLVAQNSSGLTGSITLGATIAADVTDLCWVMVHVDYPARLPKVLTQTDGIDDDVYSRTVMTDLYAEIVAAEQRKIAAIRRALSRWALSDGARNQVARGNEFTRSSESVLSSDTESPDGSGNVARLRDGWFYVLKRAMQDELTGGEQDVVRRVISAAAGVFPTNNKGLGSVAAHTPAEKTPIGRWRFVCVDDTLGQERFDGTFKATDSDDAFTFSGLQVKKNWAGPRGLGTITLARTLTKTNDATDQRFAATSACTVTGETANNTADGELFIAIVANGANWDVSFYSASTQHASKLVAKKTNVAASAAFEATEQNSSGLNVAWTMGGTVTAVTNIVLKLNPFKISNASLVPDEFTIDTTLSGTAGEIQDLLAEYLDADLNSDPLGSESISDNYAKAGTYDPFLT